MGRIWWRNEERERGNGEYERGNEEDERGNEEEYYRLPVFRSKCCYGFVGQLFFVDMRWCSSYHTSDPFTYHGDIENVVV